jgi:hypothetical protein
MLKAVLICAAFSTSVNIVKASTVNQSNAMSVPYFSQYDNLYEPGSTCGNTSGAMVVSYNVGQRIYPDTIYKEFGKSMGQSPEGLASIYRSYGLYAKSTRRGTRSEIVDHLNHNRPVVIHGYFTQSGHVVSFVGVTKSGLIANDPAGNWKRCAYCGYNASMSGEGVQYSWSELSNSVISYDGDIWYSVASASPF